MSGGSYNYLCNATLSEREDDLRRMHDRLAGLAAEYGNASASLLQQAALLERLS